MKHSSIAALLVVLCIAVEQLDAGSVKFTLNRREKKAKNGTLTAFDTYGVRMLSRRDVSYEGGDVL
jgi:hypothetical protein